MYRRRRRLLLGRWSILTFCRAPCRQRVLHHRSRRRDHHRRRRAHNVAGPLSTRPPRVRRIPSRLNHMGGGFGCDGFGPKARAVSRCGRSTLDNASCRAYSRSPASLYDEVVSAAINATRSSISGSVMASGWISSSSHGSVRPSPWL